MNEKVSIIILTYNKFDNLKKNISSIYNQTYKNIEIIISDDGSANFILEDIKKTVENKPPNINNIEIIHNEKNEGTVKNFNNAIKHASGKYIFPLSQDDSFYSENVVEDIVNSFGENLVVTGIRMIFDEQSKKYYELPDKRERVFFENERFYDYLIFRGNIISGASTYYKKEVFDRYGYFNEKYKLFEDFPFYMNILKNGEKIKLLDIKVINYAVNGISDENNPNPILQKDITQFLKNESKINKGLKKRFLEFKVKRNISILEKKNKYFRKSLLLIKFPDIIALLIIKKKLKSDIFFRLSKYI